VPHPWRRWHSLHRSSPTESLLGLGQLARPLATGEWACPDVIEVEGDRLYWRNNLEGDGWGYYPITSGPGLLEGFIRLADASPEAVHTFARRWGVLGICHHGLPATHNPRPPELPSRSGTATWCYPLRQSGWYWEPLDIWHDFARRARAVLNLAAAMGRETSTRREDWAALHDTWAQR
jgi:hypothetical protein